MKTYTSLTITVITIFIALTLCSCASQKHVDCVATSDINRNDAELAFLLSNKDFCSNNDALSMIILMTDGRDNSADFAERVKTLADKDIVCTSWNLQADQAVTKGTLAYMVCKSLGVKGGLMMQLIPSRRYAYKEAVHRELMDRGSENEPLTGPEVVGILGRAARQ